MVLYGTNVVGQYNPIRYRGYYYDTDTGFYYLQSRYYDPTIKRFISADKEISGVGGELLGYNQYAYSFNNPVNLSDESGEWPEWTKKALIVGAVVWTIAAATAVAIATCGVGSTASIAMISASITIAAKATEVSVLQIRKSKSEGKSDWDTSGDVFESLYDNGANIAAIPILMKAGTVSGKSILSHGAKKGLSLNSLAKTLSSKPSVLGKIAPFACTIPSILNLIGTFKHDDPIERAEERRIILN